MFSEVDHVFMARALELAREGLFTTTPNPRVGCVIVSDGQVVGEGWHRRAGEPHAEILALAQAAGRARGATVYLTLEPCCHHGRTPPCVQALIGAQVARVVAALQDPNPRVDGQGLAALRAAGIEVRLGLMQTEARELNLGFVSRMTRGRPWVRLKAAASLDGQTALADGQSQWITGEPARADGHAWRARACAILTGIGTVRADNPRLDVRALSTPRQPTKVLVDSRLEVEPSARLLSGAPTWVACAIENPAKERQLSDLGCEILHLPDARGKVDLRALMTELGRRGCNEVHVEAGYKLNGSLVQADVVDELLLYLAPCLIGPGQGMFHLPALGRLDFRRQLQVTGLDRVGEDIRIRARF